MEHLSTKDSIKLSSKASNIPIERTETPQATRLQVCWNDGIKWESNRLKREDIKSISLTIFFPLVKLCELRSFRK